MMMVDSKQGITALMNWAAASQLVLNEWHEEIAKKYGVPLPPNLVISRLIR